MTVKVACHIHSEWSYDASWTLPELAKFFAKRGYQVLLMTEHDRGFNQAKLDDFKQACSEASNEDILLIPGIEYSDPTNTIHILTWGNVPFFGADQETLPMLQHVADHHGLSVLAHPSRKSAWKRFDTRWTPLLNGIELWNRKSDGIRPSPHARTLVHDTKLPGFYGLDFHRINQSFPLAINLEIPRTQINESTVLETIRLKNFSLNALNFSSRHIENQPIHSTLNCAEFARRLIAKTNRSLRKYPQPKRKPAA